MVLALSGQIISTPVPHGTGRRKYSQKKRRKRKGAAKAPFSSTKHNHERTSIEIENEAARCLQDFSVSGLSTGTLLKHRWRHRMFAVTRRMQGLTVAVSFICNITFRELAGNTIVTVFFLP
jgi:hypothetical protein